jgi:hypothetical protein
MINQTFIAQAGEHYLDIKFILPLTHANSKSLVVLMDEEVVAKYRSDLPDFGHK